MIESGADSPSRPPIRLRCEYRENPAGIEETHPRLSWWVADGRRGAVQTAYHVLVASSPEVLEDGRGDLWDSGKVPSGRNFDAVYDGQPLTSRRRCWWKVRTYDADDVGGPWSEPARWEMGLLAPEDWAAKWIGAPGQVQPEAVTYLRRAFSVGAKVTTARLYATALGLYELRLNGQKVGDHILAPGWTDYRRRVMYQTYDVTEQLRTGENALGALLAEGWYCGRIGWVAEGEAFGPRPPRLLAQLELHCADGRRERFVTDGSWRCSDGPVVRSGIYRGEHHDARLGMPGWDEPGFAADDWRPAGVFEPLEADLTAQQDPPIRVTQELRPVEVRRHGPGTYVFDFGQNMVGVCRLRARGPEGTAVRLRHAEVLNADGSIYTENLRTAEATDTFVLRGEGEQVFVPRFTYHGFRYVELTGHPGEPGRETLTGLVLHTDCQRTGSFASSCEMVNRLYENIWWSQCGNMHSVLTDCPQRDERLGWLGDAQIFAPTACYNMDMAAMVEKFLRDMRDAQTPEGAFPDVCPYVSPGGVLPPAGAPGWLDAGIIIPYVMYLMYRDERLLERHFDAAARSADFVAERNPNGLWREARGNDYGDWVPAGVETDKTMFATLHHFRSACLLVEMAEALNRTADAERWQERADLVRAAFNERYLRDGHYENATQTVNALALAFGIVPEEHRATVAADLVADISERDGHLSCGFGGTQWLLPALCEEGYAEVAHRLLLNRDYPSWGYMVERGATTIWERWNSDSEGPAMNSRNHFAYGSVGEWLFRCLAGIAPDEDAPGFERIVVRPYPGSPDAELTSLRANYDSIRGPIETAWEVSSEGLELAVRVPANASATVYVPAEAPEQVTEGGLQLAGAEGVELVGVEPGRVVCAVGAGLYRFAVSA